MARNWERDNEIARLRHELVTAVLGFARSAYASPTTVPGERGELDKAACKLADKLREPEQCGACGAVLPAGKHAGPVT